MLSGIRHNPPPVNTRMHLLDLTLPTAAANLALDEALLLAAEDGSGNEVLRLWENPGHAVVLGAGGSVAADVNIAMCAADGVPILRRASGGGTVVIGPGCLCFTLVVAYARAAGLDSITTSSRYVLEPLALALGASIEGSSDLALQGRKISGSAQQRKRRHFLHHGTLLCGFDLECLPRLLHTPTRQPDYRRNRPHTEFVTNLPLDRDVLRRLLVAAWPADGDYAPVPLEAVRELVAEKYGRDEWSRRR
jgi:lipoate---protein ligase